MVKIDEHKLVDVVNFLDRVLEEGFIPKDYSPEEVEVIRNDIDEMLNQNSPEV